MDSAQVNPSLGYEEAEVRVSGAAGPVAGERMPYAILRPIAYDALSLEPTSLLGSWQQLNREKTIGHCIEQLEFSGALGNLRRLLDDGAGEFRGMRFADSDVYKVIEAVAWETGRGGDGGWTSFVDDTVSLLERVQEDDGYLDSWIQGSEFLQRWVDLESSHELYCAGHLIQAAVAVRRATGDDRLLQIAIRLADLVVSDDRGAVGPLVDAHAEMESALVELYRETGTTGYLELASRMIERRGRGHFTGSRFGSAYLQDHAPVREATEAVGHAVRQLYLAAGVVDMYLETGDSSLLDAMRELWNSAFKTKTYITGGHGSRHRDEAFGDPYELPPDRAYAETCAAIASFMWNWRMLLATGERQYADEMERVLYNALAVSVSTDGKHFFYSNPLQLRSGHDGSHEDAPTQRLAWYGCACCPPNVARLVASVHNYFATVDNSGLQIHLYSAAQISFKTPRGQDATVSLATEYPWDGRVEMEVECADEAWTLAVRVPRWCEGATLTVDGQTIDTRVDERGYVRIDRNWHGRSVVVLDLPMPIRLYRAHPRVDAVRGCVALVRGPIVYCLEQADQPEIALEDLYLDGSSAINLGPHNPELDVPVTLVGSAFVCEPPTDDLYEVVPTREENGSVGTVPISFTAIPYFRWANRSVGSMRVWLPIGTREHSSERVRADVG